MKRDWASDLRAIADGRLMLNVRNGVTVSRSMLAMIADEIDALRAVPLTPAEVGGLVKRLLLTPDCDVRQMSDNCVEAATALEAQAAELAAVKEMYAREGAKALYELERADRAEAQLAEARKALELAREDILEWMSSFPVAAQTKSLAALAVIDAARRALTGGKE